MTTGAPSDASTRDGSWSWSRSWSSGRSHDTRAALFLTAGILLVALVYGALTIPLAFGTNDDAAMLGISLGLFSDGVGDPHLVYQSAFLGMLIGAGFKAFPHFDWYSSFQMLVCLAGFATMSVLVLRRDRSPLAIASVALASWLFLAPILFELQFTQTSFVCLMTSLVILLDTTQREAFNGRLFALALGFGLLSVLIRAVSLDAAQLLVALLAGALVLDRVLDRDRVGAMRCVLLPVGFLAILTTLSMASSWLEEALFYSDPAWNAFWHHHADRAFALENWPRSIGFERIALELDRQLGITVEQYVAMVHWLPITKDLYSIEVFREMAAVIRGIDSDPTFLTAGVGVALGELRSFLAATPLFVASVGLILGISVLRAIENSTVWMRSVAIGLFWAVMPCLLVVGITMLYRLPPYRVWMPILALSLWCCLASLAVLASRCESRSPAQQPKEFAGIEQKTIFLCALLLLAALPVHRHVRAYLDGREALRPMVCQVTSMHVEAIERLPSGARAFLAPNVIHSDCYLKPFQLSYPDALVDRTIAFGWRNLTPWVRDELFAEKDDLFDVLCENDENMLILRPNSHATVQGYLRRHKPDVRLAYYATESSPAMLSCKGD